jgi:hypothetical protein
MQSASGPANPMAKLGRKSFIQDIESGVTRNGKKA